MQSNKTIYTILICLIGMFNLNAQSTAFDCEFTSSFADSFKNDCVNPTLVRAVELDSNYLLTNPSFSIETRDTILNAMMAVFSSGLPAADTVFDFLNIHEYAPMPTNELELYSTDTASQSWAANLLLNGMPSGNTYLDSTISHYKFILDTAYMSTNFAIFKFSSSMEYNMSKIMIDLASANLPVTFPIVIGDGNHVDASIESSGVKLEYTYGWGDCPSGCTFNRVWSFKVGYDCGVTYLGVTGDTTSYPGVVFPPQKVSQIDENNLMIFPNPTHGKLYFSDKLKNPNVSIYNVLGMHIADKKINSSYIDLGDLDSGVYVIISNSGEQQRKVLVHKY